MGNERTLLSNMFAFSISKFDASHIGHFEFEGAQFFEASRLRVAERAVSFKFFHNRDVGGRVDVKVVNNFE